MKKVYNKGFIMAETIVVSTVVITALIVIYVQFISIVNSYNNSFKYNSVEDMYAVDNINQYLLTDGLDELIPTLNENPYTDITNCSYTYFTEYLYCKTLFSNLNVKTVLFSKEDTTNIVSYFYDNTNPYSPGLKKFVKKIKNDKEEGRYRVIVEFNDGTFASVKLNQRSEYSITNLIVNGSFNNGLDGWYFSNNSFASVTNNILSYNFVGSFNDWVGQSQFITASKEDKFYVRVNAKAPHNNCRYGFGTNIAGNNVFIAPTLNYDGDKFLKTSSIEVPGAQFTKFYFGMYNASESGTMSFDEVLVVNLTKSFGSGKEPSKEWCDNHIPYFEGNMTIEY